nr:hypothetical protein [Lysinibacillus timonensis]
MFFQVFEKKTAESVNKFDLYDQFQFIIVTILKRELPSHYEANHILYTANLRLEKLKELAAYHRKKINMYSSVGQFHREAYDFTIKQVNQLELIIDSYISLHIESDRQRINHRLSLIDDKVTMLYQELIDYTEQDILPQLQETYWNSLKDDLMPLLAELR